MIPEILKNYFPILEWGNKYNKDTFSNDIVAAVIVTVMLVPQSLAYALLAGLPPEMGLYSAILPLIAYAIFGTSAALAVGPVAVVSLMTAGVIGGMALQGTAEYAAAAIILAFLSGLILLIMGLFRLGFLANFLSHPVISGFMTAAIVLIGMSQVKHLFGISAKGRELITLSGSLWDNIGNTNFITLALGVWAIGVLTWARKGLKPALERLGMKVGLVKVLSKTGPLIVVSVTTFIAWLFNLESYGVSLVGTLPSGLPPLTLPNFDFEIWSNLFVAALLISMIGFVESVSVAQTLAARKGQRISPDQELIGLGVANLAASVSGGYPVTGGLSRSVVNYDSGAETPAAGILTAIGILLAALFLTPLLYFLPKATLAAIIVVAVISLLDFSTLKKSWAYSKPDFAAVVTTILITLAFGVKTGVTTGVILSIILYLYRTSRPHIAEVGRIPDTEHFRNIHRHCVETVPTVLSIRIDESLFFANTRYLEDYILDRVADSIDLRHVILMCSAVNEIDMSALETLESINSGLKRQGITLHMSEVKGPVTDGLRMTHFFDELTGEVFLSQNDAYTQLAAIGYEIKGHV